MAQEMLDRYQLELNKLKQTIHADLEQTKMLEQTIASKKAEQTQITSVIERLTNERNLELQKLETNKTDLIALEQEKNNKVLKKYELEKEKKALTSNIKKAKQEALRQEALRQEALRQEALRQEALRQDAERQEAERQEAERQEAERQEALRQEALIQEALRQEALRQEALRQEALRQEALRQESLRQEALRQEAERQEALRQEAERQEALRQEAAKPVLPNYTLPDVNVAYTSEPSNSYNKCLYSMQNKFDIRLIERCVQLIDRHDRNSFNEQMDIGIYGNARRVLYIKGTYNFVFIAHVKTIEMSWREFPYNV